MSYGQNTKIQISNKKTIRYMDVVKMFNDFIDYLTKGSDGSVKFKKDLELDGQLVPGFVFDTNYQQIGLARILDTLDIKYTTNYGSIKSEKGSILVKPESAERMLDIAGKCHIDTFHANAPKVDLEKTLEAMQSNDKLRKTMMQVIR